MAVRKTAREDRVVDQAADRIAEAVRDRVKPLIREYRRLGRDRDMSFQAIVDRVVAAIPSPSPWSATLGAFYTTSQVATLLGNVTRQALEDRRLRRTLLALRTEDGYRIYPVFQFNGRHVLDGLGEVLQAFDPATIDEWSLAGWLVAGRRDLDGQSVIDLLRADRVERAVEVARRAAARLGR